MDENGFRYVVRTCWPEVEMRAQLFKKIIGVQRCLAFIFLSQSVALPVCPEAWHHLSQAPYRYQDVVNTATTTSTLRSSVLYTPQPLVGRYETFIDQWSARVVDRMRGSPRRQSFNKFPHFLPLGQYWFPLKANVRHCWSCGEGKEGRRGCMLPTPLLFTPALFTTATWWVTSFHVNNT